MSDYDNQIYLLDVDITRNYAGLINKNEIIEHLLLQDFRRQNSKEYAGIEKVILENDNFVGNGTLTYMDYTEPKHAKRNKFYLKLLCQWTSPGVAKTTGHHLMDYLYCPDKQLGETFKNKLGLERGITRHEITIYGGKLPEYNEMLKMLDEQFKYVDAPIFYYVPACNLWRNLTDQITNNLIIYDKVEKILTICYYVNLQTRKATCIRKKLKDYTPQECDRILKYTISHYSYKMLPCNVITTEKLTDDNNIKLTLKTYRKLHGDTQLGKPLNIYISLKELTHANDKDKEKQIAIADIEQTGLKETQFIKFFIP